MYFTELTENQDKKIRIQKVMSDVLKIDQNINVKSENEIYSKSVQILTSGMIKKVRGALR